MIALLQSKFQTVLTCYHHSHRKDKEEHSEYKDEDPLPRLFGLKVDNGQGEHDLHAEAYDQEAPEHAQVELILRLQDSIVQLGEQKDNHPNESEVHKPLKLQEELQGKNVLGTDWGRIQLDIKVSRDGEGIIFIGVLFVSSASLGFGWYLGECA